MNPLFTELSREEADLFDLVLTASDIPHEISKKKSGWEVRVPEAYGPKALRQIMAFHSENQPWREKSPEPVSGDRDSTRAGFWAAGIILAVYVWLGPLENDHALFRAKGALARAILAGEVWRAVTALFLHVDLPHLLGNMAGLAIFGTAVCRFSGYGAGLLLILATGILGNLENALFHQGMHLSAGASTAVFGAIGLLGGFRLLPEKDPHPLSRVLGPWVILGAGVALLALLGNGKRADFMAHAFGYSTGIAMGLVYARFKTKPAEPRYQFLCLYAAVAVCVAAWAFSGP